MRLVLDNAGRHACRWHAVMAIAAKIACASWRHWSGPNGQRFHLLRQLEGFVHVVARHGRSEERRSHGVVIDAFARRIVGWRVSTTPHAGFVLDALEQAVHERRPV